MPVRRLPHNPSLERLRNEARTVQRSAQAGAADALALLREFHPRGAALVSNLDTRGSLRLTDAQLAVARQYGFPSWPKLRRHLETVARYSRWPHKAPTDMHGGAASESLAYRFLRLACLTYGGDRPERRAEARALLAAHPELATTNVYTMAACGEAAAIRSLVAQAPHLANQQGGPHTWEPLLYLTYARISDDAEAALETARALLDHGADPNAGYLWEGLTSPFTALTGALGEGEGGNTQPPHPAGLALARLLLEAGADPNDSQALYNRQFRPGAAHLELLLQFGLGRGDGGIWHARLAPNHPTPAQLLEDQLLWAVQAGMVDRVQLLLAHGVRVDGLGTEHPGVHGQSAYALAVLNGHQEIVERLQAAGARTDVLDPVTAFLGCCLRGDRLAVERLLASDPTALPRTLAREPHAMIRAAERGRPEAVPLLASLGFDVNARRRITALHAAAWNGDLEMATALLQLGADPDVLDEEHGATPLGWARYNGQTAVADLLTPLTPPPTPPPTER